MTPTLYFVFFLNRLIIIAKKKWRRLRIFIFLQILGGYFRSLPRDPLERLSQLLFHMDIVGSICAKF